MPQRRTMGAITRTERRHLHVEAGFEAGLARRGGLRMIVLAGAARLLAHDPGLSAMDVRVQDKRSSGCCSLAASDAAIAGGQ